MTPTSTLPRSGTQAGCREKRRDIDELDQAILTLSRKLNAQHYQFLVLVREFDERAGWLQWSLASCTQWLAWRCDLSQSAARERVRIAHALKALPEISQAFAVGDLSYSKVRALTRVANAQNESALLAMARTMTAAHVDQHCQQRRNGSADAREDAGKAQARRSLRSWRDEARGMVTITLELPMAEGLLFEKAIDKASADQDGSYAAPDDSTSWQALQADAAMAMAQAYLSGLGAKNTHQSNHQPGPTTATSTADHYQVMVHVDHQALSGQQGQSEMPVETVRRLCCDGSIVPIIEDDQGQPLNVGRKRRIVSTSIRRALWSRDRGCAYPGCSHTRFVDAHHIEHWANGGETSLDNTVLLCSNHHQLVHEGGYSIHRDQHGSRYFQRPDGRAVPACGYHPSDWQDDYSQNDASSFDGKAVVGGASADALSAMEPVSEYQYLMPLPGVIVTMKVQSHFESASYSELLAD